MKIIYKQKVIVMKKIVLMFVAALAVIGCNKIEDTPEVSFYEESYTVSSEGGEITIPVSSTGVDDIFITYQSEGDAWEVDPETGDRTPSGWIEVVKVIEHYDATRALAKWDSGICLRIAPNEGGVERIGYVTVRSFMVEAKISIKQDFKK